MFGRIHTARIGWHKEKAILWLLVLTFLLTIFSPIAGGVEGAEIYCPECGTKNDLTNKFCGNCGTLLWDYCHTTCSRRGGRGGEGLHGKGDL
ncbi:zinc-ribbon domain-containing protein [candidate division TA06 bacterium]|nr:zinc-ribbon domain-containing protein [candidate division TA06 bacterium]